MVASTAAVGAGVVAAQGLVPSANNTVMGNISGAPAFPIAIPISSITYDLDVGTSTITGGTTTRILYDNAGVLGEYTISGTGTVVAMATAASLSAPIIKNAAGDSVMTVNADGSFQFAGAGSAAGENGSFYSTDNFIYLQAGATSSLSLGPTNGVTLRSIAALAVISTGVTADIFLTAGRHVRLTPGAGSVVAGTGVIATNATDGFLYIPTCAGTPTGVPTSFAGYIPMIYDTTNHQFWFYDGAGWKQPKTPAAAAIITWQ